MGRLSLNLGNRVSEEEGNISYGGDMQIIFLYYLFATSNRYV